MPHLTEDRDQCQVYSLQRKEIQIIIIWLGVCLTLWKLRKDGLVGMGVELCMCDSGAYTK